ncbi:hypothetical protein QBC43DRAFT_320460 [Cladorrhinum sp. PSN259]|nr:hypothetical protein QBC43DRAFT_320460 [Cladorrhinum sp. PSN259]
MQSLRIPSAAALRTTTTTTRQSLRRTFSSTSPTKYRQNEVPNSSIPIPSVTATHPEIPPYPLGPRQTYHQSNTGLYGSATIRFGNKVSNKNEIKTRRNWKPNVQHKNLFSQSLGVFVRTRVTARVLRTIDKAGGLDEYLLGIKPQRIADLGPWGWRLRWRVMQTDSVQKRFKAERKKLGLKFDEEGQVTEIKLPDGTVVSAKQAEEYIAETDRLLAEEGGEENVVLLGGGGEEETKERGFMAEEKKKNKKK